MDICEENPQISIRKHMNSNKGKSQFHVKPNGARDELQPLGHDGCFYESGVPMGPERSGAAEDGVGSIPGSSRLRRREQ